MRPTAHKRTAAKESERSSRKRARGEVPKPERESSITIQNREAVAAEAAAKEGDSSDDDYEVKDDDSEAEGDDSEAEDEFTGFGSDSDAADSDDKEVPHLDDDDEDGDECEDEELDPNEPPAIADPYATLGIDKDADDKAITTAYRKAALKYHPDRLPADEKEGGKVKFQEIAFAYGILSDPTRRARYNRTGRTDGMCGGDDDDTFDWKDFFSSAMRESVTAAIIQAVREEYKHSEEEKADVLKAYVEQKGDMEGILEHVMLSDHTDEDRFGAMIEEAIEAGEVKLFDRFKRSMSKKGKEGRRKKSGKEEAAAMKMAKELGVHKALFGGGDDTDSDDDDESQSKSSKSSKSKSKSKSQAPKPGSEASLAQLIQSRQRQRNGFLDSMIDKYGGDPRSSSAGGPADEPSEEAFAEMQRRQRKPKPSTTTTTTRNGADVKERKPRQTRKK